MKNFHVDLETNQSTDEKEMCVYVDYLPEPLKKQIEALIKTNVRFSEPIYGYLWYYHFIFSNSVPDQDIRVVIGLLRSNDYVIADIQGRQYLGSEWDGFCKET